VILLTLYRCSCQCLSTGSPTSVNFKPDSNHSAFTECSSFAGINCCCPQSNLH